MFSGGSVTRHGAILIGFLLLIGRSWADNLHAEFDLLQTFFYQPDGVLKKRLVDQEESLAHLKACVDLIVAYANARLEAKDPGTFFVVMVLKPGKRIKLWIEGIDVPLEAGKSSELAGELAKLDVPSVIGGPVAFAFCMSRESVAPKEGPCNDQDPQSGLPIPKQ